MIKHTKGPWKVCITTTRGEFVNEFRVRTEDEGHICEVGPVNTEANSNLIAAAPLMYEALSKYEILFKEATAEASWNKKATSATDWGKVNSILCEMRNAILKADGKK